MSEAEKNTLNIWSSPWQFILCNNNNQLKKSFKSQDHCNPALDTLPQEDNKCIWYGQWWWKWGLVTRGSIFIPVPWGSSQTGRPDPLFQMSQVKGELVVKTITHRDVMMASSWSHMVSVARYQAFNETQCLNVNSQVSTQILMFWWKKRVILDIK